MNVNSCEMMTLNMIIHLLNRVQFDLHISQVQSFKIVTSTFKHNKKKATKIVPCNYNKKVRYLLIDYRISS